MRRSILLMTGVITMTVLADILPMAGELEAEGILKSFQSPVSLAFWLLWGGLLSIPLSLFFTRGFLKMVIVALGVFVLILGLVTGTKNYDFCGKCGTKLERWYDMGHHAACPRCSLEARYRHVPETFRKAMLQDAPDSQGTAKKIDY